PGPVLVDIPKDVQVQMQEYEPVPVVEKEAQRPVKLRKIQAAADMIAEAVSPYIYIGGGVITADASEEVLALAEKIDAPIGSTLMGLSAIDNDNERFLGMVGMHGHYPASVGQDEADLIIAIGARFSDRATGDVSKYAKGARIIHMDIDRAEIDKNISSDLGIGGDLKEALTALIEAVKPARHPAWNARLDALRAIGEEQLEATLDPKELTPHSLIWEVARHTEADTPVVTDVGQHQMWTAQYYPFHKRRTFITSGGLGTMGFGMGAAIGAAQATGKKTVLFTGDGSFGMNLNELATAVSQNTPLVIVIMNNNVLGMVRQWQNLFFDKHYSQTTLNRQTDFVKLAEAFGARGLRIMNRQELGPVMAEAFAHTGPVVVDVAIDPDAFVLPMLPPGGSFDDIITEV
ncbi:thiamine pyrophosphate-binding protein, partial [Faecalibaculum rodentium]